MGGAWSRTNHEPGLIEEEFQSQEKNERKRTRSDNMTPSEEEKERIEEENLHTPKRKKMTSTSKYIYETLFVNGENSDVTIKALGKDWKLHKLYLCQSNYFSSMFSGSWKETNQDYIPVDIPDENIDIEALEIVFGSLYRDDVLISPTKVVQVLAASTLLGLDGLIWQCVDVMKETLSCKTVCTYNTAAQMYGQNGVITHCQNWLERNLTVSFTAQLLNEISPEIMTQLIKSENLFVMQVEMDLYTLLKKWSFLQMNPGWDGSNKQLTTKCDTFWKAKAVRCRECKTEFLTTEEGQPFRLAFAALRLQHIITDLTSTRILDEDRIIPQVWLRPVYRQQWLQMVRVEQGIDAGPQTIDERTFNAFAMRCGRTLTHGGDYCWRWTGYNYGLDLLLSASNRTLIFKRNTHSQVCPGAVYLHGDRSLLYKVTVAACDTLGNTSYFKTVDIVSLCLAKDEEKVVMTLDEDVPYPLHVSCQFLVFSPRKHYEDMMKVRYETKDSRKVVSLTAACDRPSCSNEQSCSVGRCSASSSHFQAQSATDHPTETSSGSHRGGSDNVNHGLPTPSDDEDNDNFPLPVPSDDEDNDNHPLSDDDYNIDDENS